MSPADACEVAIVLGAAVAPDGGPSPALLRRLRHGIALIETGRARHLLLAGGIVRHPPAEAHLMRDLALAAGLPEDLLIAEDASRNTLENARNCRAVLASRGWRGGLLVTDRYHMPRALYTFRRFGMTVRPSPPPERYAAPGAALREALALAVYLWRVERALRKAPPPEALAPPPRPWAS